MQQPLDQFSPEEIKKNSIIALYANEAEDNNGLPFFLGKVLRVFNKNEENDDDDVDEGQSDQKAPKYVVKIHEYIQTKINEQPTGKYQLHNEHGEKKKGFENHKIQGGHFGSRNSPNCFLDRVTEQGEIYTQSHDETSFI